MAVHGQSLWSGVQSLSKKPEVFYKGNKLMDFHSLMHLTTDDVNDLLLSREEQRESPEWKLLGEEGRDLGYHLELRLVLPLIWSSKMTIQQQIHTLRVLIQNDQEPTSWIIHPSFDVHLPESLRQYVHLEAEQLENRAVEVQKSLEKQKLEQEMEKERDRAEEIKQKMEQERLQEEIAKEKMEKSVLEFQLTQEKLQKEALEQELEKQKLEKEALEQELENEKLGLEKQQQLEKEKLQHKLETNKKKKKKLKEELEQERLQKEMLELELEKEKVEKLNFEQELERKKQEKAKCESQQILVSEKLQINEHNDKNVDAVLKEHSHESLIEMEVDNKRKGSHYKKKRWSRGLKKKKVKKSPRERSHSSPGLKRSDVVDVGCSKRFKSDSHVKKKRRSGIMKMAHATRKTKTEDGIILKVGKKRHKTIEKEMEDVTNEWKRQQSQLQFFFEKYQSHEHDEIKDSDKMTSPKIEENQWKDTDELLDTLDLKNRKLPTPPQLPEQSGQEVFVQEEVQVDEKGKGKEPQENQFQRTLLTEKRLIKIKRTGRKQKKGISDRKKSTKGEKRKQKKELYQKKKENGGNHKEGGARDEEEYPAERQVSGVQIIRELERERIRPLPRNNHLGKQLQGDSEHSSDPDLTLKHTPRKQLFPFYKVSSTSSSDSDIHNSSVPPGMKPSEIAQESTGSSMLHALLVCLGKFFADKVHEGRGIFCEIMQEYYKTGKLSGVVDLEWIIAESLHLRCDAAAFLKKFFEKMRLQGDESVLYDFWHRKQEVWWKPDCGHKNINKRYSSQVCSSNPTPNPNLKQFNSNTNLQLTLT